MELIDVHAHLTDERYDDVMEVLEKACEGGVKKIVCSAYNFLSSKEAVEFSKKYNSVFATVGIHPENIDEFEEEILDRIEILAEGEKVVAVGEIGLDYHYFEGLSAEQIEEKKRKQKEVFIRQIELANKLKLPVQIHSRDAMGDTIEILKQHRLNKASLLHCYSGSVESAKILMDLGFSFSFGGVVTFANAKTAVEVVKSLPIDRILLETDCPYLSPVPFRGKRNEPKNVVYVADMIAKIKGMKFEEVVEKTTENARRMFGI